MRRQERGQEKREYIGKLRTASPQTVFITVGIHDDHIG